ncbi:MAG: hypothetical protein NVSMB5_22360 [Candidatus Velthaea sp.]
MPNWLKSVIVPGWLRVLFGIAVVAAAFAPAQPAAALPLFAHQYGLSCQKCHAVVPRLNDFGQAFMENGYRLPGGQRHGNVVPLSTKINLAYTSEPDSTGLPRAVVDEIELLTGGTIGSRANYFVESYVVDGGNHGSVRDAWLGWRLTPDGARIPMRVLAGQFTLPVPVDPETFRETAGHYAIFDQTVGTNGFNFFDPKAGAALRFGASGRGTQVEFDAVRGHERHSGLPAQGTDVMTSIQHTMGPLVLSAYRYGGARPDGVRLDRFARTGFGLTFGVGRWTSETVVQTGTDSSVDGAGTAFASSGGFSQLRYEFNRKIFSVVRYDGTQDTNGFARSATALLGYRLAHNTRFTLEDVITHSPSAKHTLHAQYLIGY